jgi:tripartite-type tricarboxylate transporter receptor subunit TctC
MIGHLNGLARRAIRLARGWAGAALVVALASPAHGAAYPARTVRIVVPHAAGGAVDAVARVLAQALAERLGQAFVVENRTGASGNIGSEFVARAPANGYTLLINASIHVLNPFVFRSLPFDPVADFAPISLIASGPLLLVTVAPGPVTSLKGLIAAARARPGTLSFATSGLGSAGHFAEVLFQRRAGVDLITVPYRGSAPALADVASGQVTAMIDPILSALPLVQSGQLTALGLTGRTRSALLPQVRTIAESGLPDFEAYSWYGIWAPAGTAPEIVDRLQRGVAEALRRPAVRAPLVAEGFEIVGSSPAAFAVYIRAETAKYARLVADAHLTFE